MSVEEVFVAVRVVVAVATLGVAKQSVSVPLDCRPARLEPQSADVDDEPIGGNMTSIAEGNQRRRSATLKVPGRRDGAWRIRCSFLGEGCRRRIQRVVGVRIVIAVPAADAGDIVATWKLLKRLRSDVAIPG